MKKIIVRLTFYSATFNLQSVLQMPCSTVPRCVTKESYASIAVECEVVHLQLHLRQQSKPNNAAGYEWTEIDEGCGACKIATCILAILWLYQSMLQMFFVQNMRTTELKPVFNFHLFVHHSRY